MPIDKQPLLIVISGPSGVGKDTVVQAMKARQMPFHFVVTATTRPPRQHETEGVDYFFVSHQRFAEMIEKDELLEYAHVYDDYKGVPREQVTQALESGMDVIMRLDVQGAETIKAMAPDALLIFLQAQSEQELFARLSKRRTESQEALALRIATARKELERLHVFDYTVVNGDSQLEATIETIEAIIKAEHHRVKPREVSL